MDLGKIIDSLTGARNTTFEIFTLTLKFSEIRAPLAK